ncbi:MAG: hypothetical protein KatS3mg032_0837 [Cyclobacteriaceae bacterium]|nr:MAG: hypothetical protein KatS3mg032_0837 [Cyclobacteriaceae bacterium]
MNVKTVVTGDGSHTLYVAELDETYHSRHGARQESLYVFIQNALEPALHKSQGVVRVLEVGFGTGLNAWLTSLLAGEQKRHIRYTAIEAFPLPEAVWGRLNYAARHQAKAFAQLHRCGWNTCQSIHSWFELEKLATTLQDARLPAAFFDVVYFDAFAPTKQPELWTMEMLAKTAGAMRKGGIWVTYSARGEVRRNLAQLGLKVERLPGPPGKKHMLRAIRI